MDLQSLRIERKPQSPARRGNPWPLRLTLLGVAGAATWLFWPWLHEFGDRVRLPEVRTAVIATSAPAAAAAIRGTAANGYVVAARRAALSSDVPGRIVELAVREGSVVKKGDVVARLYADEYRAALQRATADAATAEANVVRASAAAEAVAAELEQVAASLRTAEAQRDEAKANVAWTKAECERVGSLVEGKIGSPRDLERAIADRDAATARLASLESALAASRSTLAAATARRSVAAADLEVARAQRDAAVAARTLAQATLDKTDVRAPFDGVVVLKDAEIGEVVSPNVVGGSNARGAVCTMVDFDSLEVQANVPETTLASVRQGAPADVFLDAFPDDRYEGRVDRIWPTADRQKATVEVRVKLAKRDERLRPEMGVRIVFRAADAPDPAAQPAEAAGTLLVDEKAIVQSAGRSGAFVLERDVVRFVPATLGDRRNGRVAVLAGLAAGQSVVLEPPAGLQDGDRVRPHRD